jgi:DMSO/TMAO reductase YedYZ molybdopterin-dependent catalytic subunit
MTTWQRRWLGALAGLLAGAAAVSIGAGAAVLVGGPSPVTAVGEQAIDRAPGPIREFAIRMLGTADKPALVAGVLVVLAIVSAVAGALGVTRPNLAVAVAAVVGLIGVVAAWNTRAVATTQLARTVPGLAALVVAVGGLALLLRAASRLPRASVGDWRKGSSRENFEPPTEAARPPTGALLPSDGFDRRAFIASAAAVGAVGLSGVALARYGVSSDAVASRNALVIPAPADPAPPVAAGVDLGVEGVSPFRTPLADFYRVDTALVPPRVDAASWRLRIHGLVDREVRLSLDDLLARPMIERDITLTSVSNEVGGPYVGSARWTGVPLGQLLAEAGPQARADALKSTAVDGFTVGTPLSVVTDGRDAMLAVAMNGEPLPFVHGFPVRMIVPGLYGYVSACKWITDIDVTRFADFTAYWTDRGWAEQAPVKVASRIDTPRNSADVTGTVAVAGVAWAQHRGISRVDVRVDEGPWQPAELAAEDTVDTWRQWLYRWDTTQLSRGPRRIQVRATDGDGTTQPGERTPTAPDGATGWHTVVVHVG